MKIPIDMGISDMAEIGSGGIAIRDHTAPDFLKTKLDFADI